MCPSTRVYCHPAAAAVVAGVLAGYWESFFKKKIIPHIAVHSSTSIAPCWNRLSVRSEPLCAFPTSPLPQPELCRSAARRCALQVRQQLGPSPARCGCSVTTEPLRDTDPSCLVLKCWIPRYRVDAEDYTQKVRYDVRRNKPAGSTIKLLRYFMATEWMLAVNWKSLVKNITLVILSLSFSRHESLFTK